MIFESYLSLDAFDLYFLKLGVWFFEFLELIDRLLLELAMDFCRTSSFIWPMSLATLKSPMFISFSTKSLCPGESDL